MSLIREIIMPWVLAVLLANLIVPNSACWSPCTCDEPTGKVSCDSVTNQTLPSLLSHLPEYTKDIEISNSAFRKPSAEDIVKKLHFLTHVRQVTIEYCNNKQVGIDLHVLDEIPYLEELRISFCEMERVSPKSLGTMKHLLVLDLSHNGISNIEEYAFKGMKSLEVLILHNNTIGLLPTHAFQDLDFVEIVDLSHNNITHIHPMTFYNLTKLQTIYLADNQLETLHAGTFENASSSLDVYLKGNAWNCNCGLVWLIADLASPDPVSSIKTTLKHWDTLTCHQPESLKGLPIYSVKDKLLTCSAPSLDVYPEDVEIYNMHSTTMNCNASGYPSPSVYWKTPLGILAHPSHRMWLYSDIPEHRHSLWYAGMPTYFNSTISALANGSLVITQFRYYFAGKYICVAVNPVGMESVNVNVTIGAGISQHMLVSIIIGFGSCFAFLLFGIMAGAIRMCAERTCKCCQKKGVYRPDFALVVDTPYGEEHIDCEFDYSPFSDGTWPRFTPFMPHWSPYASPKKCVTPAEVPFEDEKEESGIKIKDTLEDVRTRLKQGIERASGKIRTSTLTVKENTSKKLQNIKESTSHTMQTIKESGSLYVKSISKTTGDYAHRVKVGVALGVNQMKNQVQSVKELCGTGNIAQTISVATVTEGPTSATNKSQTMIMNGSADHSTSIIAEAIIEESPTHTCSIEERPDSPVAGPSGESHPTSPAHVYISCVDDSDCCSNDEMFNDSSDAMDETAC